MAQERSTRSGGAKRRPSPLAPAGAAVAAVVLAAPAVADLDAPFRTRNLAPLASIFGVPAWERPSLDTEFGLTAELANHYRLSTRGGETMVMDGETWRTALHVRHRLGERWSLGVELPYYQQSGGVLDDVIDAWHSAFNMPDGGRNGRAEDQILYVLERDATRFVLLDHRAGGLGDVQVGIGRVLGRDDGFLLKGTLKLPTGEERLLAGSGATDFALTLLRSRSVALGDRAASYFWGVGALKIGRPDVVRFEARGGAVLGMLGGSLRALPRFGVKAQLDVHTPFYDSALEELSDPGVQATVGAWWDLSDRGVLEVAVNEDLSVSTSPDVVLHMLLRWTF